MWITRVLVGVAIACQLAVDVEAAEKKKKAKPAPVPAAPAAQLAPVKSEADLAKEQLVQTWQQKLQGAWSLELRPPTAEQGSPQQDTLTFDGRRVVSGMLTQEGYGGSNFSLAPQDDQTASWETMQMNPGGDIALWRGELTGQSMSGMLSRQPAQGEAVTWSFTATKAHEPSPAAP